MSLCKYQKRNVTLTQPSLPGPDLDLARFVTYQAPQTPPTLNQWEQEAETNPPMYCRSVDPVTPFNIPGELEDGVRPTATWFGSDGL